MREETPREALERIHRDVAPALGEMCIRLSVRKVGPSTIRAWANSLEYGVNELRKLADKLEGK